jgi:septal ring factor EnvC (AmiA/AmiB activator)
MGAARFAAATQARTDLKLGAALSAERVRRVKQVSDLKARWASEVAALQSQLRTARTEHTQQMQGLVENHAIEVTTLQRQLTATRDEVNKLRSTNARHASELKSLEGVKGFIETIRGAHDAEQSK